MHKLVAVSLALAAASCNAPQDMGAAEKQVAAFHRAYDAERFSGLWERSSPTLKELAPKPQFLGVIEELRRRLGPVKSSERTGFNVSYETGGSQVTLTYQTTFENGEGTETFVYDTGEPPLLMGWHVVSPALEGPAGPAELEKADTAGE